VTHDFLSDSWIEAALAMRAEYLDQIPAPEESIRMNQIITDSPFGAEPIEIHLDTSEGVPRIDRGHIEEADVTITTDYTTAKALFVAGDQQLAMQAFMSGKIMVTGDIAKIMTMQASAVSRTELQLEVATRLQELTAD
jgi:hypothetical protein